MGANAMGMGMGAGFGFMMPGMIQQAMQGQPGAAPGYPQAPGQVPPGAGQPGVVPPAALPPAAAAAAGTAAAAGAPTGEAPAGASAGGAPGGGLDFGDLAPSAVDPKQLVRTVAQSAGWQVEEHGDSWQITVPIGSLRKQTVTVDFAGRDENVHGIISYTSKCGPASEKNALLLLKYNMKMTHGAFAVQDTDAGEYVVVQANELADALDAMEVTRVITAIAWQADKVEEKLSGNDDH